jgi:NAD(P)-dependent dehydrogenase (short-subunit alcohol dehydrogenase family)
MAGLSTGAAAGLNHTTWADSIVKPLGETLCRVEDKPDTQLVHGLNVAFYGPFWAMQAACPLMKAQRWGRVINMCSLAGVYAFMGTVEYNSTKEALRALTCTAVPFGIVANVICPGAKGASLRRLFEERPEMERAPWRRPTRCDASVTPKLISDRQPPFG